MHPDPQGRVRHPLAWCTGRRYFGIKQTVQLVLKEDGAQFGMLPQMEQSPSQQGCSWGWPTLMHVAYISPTCFSVCALLSLLDPLSRVFSSFQPPAVQPKSRKTSSWNHPFFSRYQANSLPARLGKQATGQTVLLWEILAQRLAHFQSQEWMISFPVSSEAVLNRLRGPQHVHCLWLDLDQLNPIIQRLSVPHWNEPRSRLIIWWVRALVWAMKKRVQNNRRETEWGHSILVTEREDFLISLQGLAW